MRREEATDGVRVRWNEIRRDYDANNAGEKLREMLCNICWGRNVIMLGNFPPAVDDDGQTRGE